MASPPEHNEVAFRDFRELTQPFLRHGPAGWITSIAHRAGDSVTNLATTICLVPWKVEAGQAVVTAQVGDLITFCGRACDIDEFIV